MVTLIRQPDRHPMNTAVSTDTPTSWTRFARHYLLMVVAMYAGMIVLNPVYGAAASRFGYADPWVELPVFSSVVMAVNMTIPMALLMVRHGHATGRVTEMAAAMVVPTAAAAGLYALGLLATDQLMTVAHLGMFPAMFFVMVRRYRDYAS
jgi:uncharacterized membrane protein YhaH (DUF805 family)